MKMCIFFTIADIRCAWFMGNIRYLTLNIVLDFCGPRCIFHKIFLVYCPTSTDTLARSSIILRNLHFSGQGIFMVLDIFHYCSYSTCMIFCNGRGYILHIVPHLRKHWTWLNMPNDMLPSRLLARSTHHECREPRTCGLPRCAHYYFPIFSTAMVIDGSPWQTNAHI